MNKIELEKSALDCEKIACHSCGQVCDINERKCIHCHSCIHPRKPASTTRAWAYLLTSIILFFPANLLPITHASSLIYPPQDDTIMSSIILLWHHQSYLVAGVIFTASIFTPFFKIIVLTYLLLHQTPTSPPIRQVKLYKFIHFIGRWSFIDVFVVSLLSALIHSKLAVISPGPGIFAFAGVVLFTMFATNSFDIRLLWDNYRHHAKTRN